MNEQNCPCFRRESMGTEARHRNTALRFSADLQLNNRGGKCATMHHRGGAKRCRAARNSCNGADEGHSLSFLLLLQKRNPKYSAKICQIIYTAKLSDSFLSLCPKIICRHGNGKGHADAPATDLRHIGIALGIACIVHRISGIVLRKSGKAHRIGQRLCGRTGYVAVRNKEKESRHYNIYNVWLSPKK